MTLAKPSKPSPCPWCGMAAPQRMQQTQHGVHATCTACGRPHGVETAHGPLRMQGKEHQAFLELSRLQQSFH